MESCPRLRSQRAFTRIELVVVLVVVALFTLLLIPALYRERQRQLQLQCQNNLRQTGTAYRLWSDDSSPRYPMARVVTDGGSLEYVLGGQLNRHFQTMSNELGGDKALQLLTCPADTRLPASNFASLQNSNISYFAGVDADESDPQMILSGDRNWVTNGTAVSAGMALVRPTDVVTWSGAIHRWSGNLLLADGSANKFDSQQLQVAITNTGTNLNRLVFP